MARRRHRFSESAHPRNPGCQLSSKKGLRSSIGPSILTEALEFIVEDQAVEHPAAPAPVEADSDILWAWRLVLRFRDSMT